MLLVGFHLLKLYILRGPYDVCMSFACFLFNINLPKGLQMKISLLAKTDTYRLMLINECCPLLKN